MGDHEKMKGIERYSVSIIVGSVLSIAVGALALYYLIAEVVMRVPLPASLPDMVFCFLSLLSASALLIAGIFTLLLKEKGKFIVIVLMELNVAFTLLFQFLIKTNVHSFYVQLFREYILPFWTVYFATEPWIFKIKEIEPQMITNSWAGFFVRLVVCGLAAVLLANSSNRRFD